MLMYFMIKTTMWDLAKTVSAQPSVPYTNSPTVGVPMNVYSQQAMPSVQNRVTIISLTIAPTRKQYFRLTDDAIAM